MFVNETLVALLESKRPILCQLLSVATGRDVVTAFGQTVAPVVTVSTELVCNATKGPNLQVSELSFLSGEGITLRSTSNHPRMASSSSSTPSLDFEPRVLPFHTFSRFLVNFLTFKFLSSQTSEKQPKLLFLVQIKTVRSLPARSWSTWKVVKSFSPSNE